MATYMETLTTTARQTPTEILAWITDAFASNKTIYVATATRITKITPKVAQLYNDVGRPYFRASEKSLYMVVGRHYVCINYCDITARSI